MFAQVNFPDVLAAEELDRYLERGWFRMGQSIFTTNFLNFKNHLYSAIWLRASLREYVPGKTQQKIARLNESFRIEIQKASITPEKELLFAVYKQNVSFEASASLQQLLYGRSDYNIYNTQEITLYDGDKLIAVGYFDIGLISAEGISSFYDPSYKKNSLGKYLIFLKMSYCKSQRLRYFYPGYFVPGYKAFDYKLDLGRAVLEYFQLASQKWRSIHMFSDRDIPIQVMQAKLFEVKRHFDHLQIDCSIMQYEFFDANLIPDLKGMELFDFPVFLSFASPDVIRPVLITYDVRTELFYILQCLSIWSPNAPHSTEGFYSSHLLRVEEEIFSSSTAQPVIDLVLANYRAEGLSDAQSFT